MLSIESIAEQMFPSNTLSLSLRNTALITTLIILQGLGECNKLRVVTSSKPSRVIGNGGNIVIQDTQVL